MKKLLIFSTFLVFCFTSSAVANLLTNGDFETGDLTGWDSIGAVSVVDFATPSLPDFLASVQGMDDNFALIGFGTGSGVSGISQDFMVSGADSITLEFNYAFDFLDLNPVLDDTFLAVTTVTGDIVGSVTMLDLSSSLIGADFGTYSQTFTLDPSWMFDGEMSFTLSEVGGFLSGGTLSFVGIDNVSVTTTTAPVPEPSTMLLMGAGIVGLLTYNRRRSKAKS